MIDEQGKQGLLVDWDMAKEVIEGSEQFARQSERTVR